LHQEKKIVFENLDHGHDKTEETNLNRQKLNNKLKRKAVDDICEKPAKLIHKELSNHDINTITSNDIDLIRKNIHRARSSILSKLPTTIEDVHELLKQITIHTNNDENFLIINDPITHIIMFTCNTNLSHLSKISTIYVDGTFKCCPKQFTQFFTIHGLKEPNSFIPLVFFLLPNKAKNTYEHAFKFLCAECDKLQLQFTPQTIYADFESAIHTAVYAVWPEINLRGCRFHLGQSWWRKIQDLKLSTFFRNDNSEIGRFLKYIFGLPFLTPDEVGDFFASDLMGIKPVDEKIDLFLDYLVDNYISPESTFPPRIWADFSHSTLRTTNNCESFHSKFNGMFYHAHPNIYQFIEALKYVQQDSYIKLRSSIKRRKPILAKEDFIKEKMYEYSSGQISRLEFVKKISYKFNPITNL